MDIMTADIRAGAEILVTAEGRMRACVGTRSEVFSGDGKKER